MSHACPGPGCNKQVPTSQLACGRHWYQVPDAIRTAVYRAWDRGAGAGTEEHRAAMQAAIRAMREVKP